MFGRKNSVFWNFPKWLDKFHLYFLTKLPQNYFPLNATENRIFKKKKRKRAPFKNRLNQKESRTLKTKGDSILLDTKNAIPLKTFPLTHFSRGTILAKLKTATSKRESHPHLEKQGPPFKKGVNQKVTKFQGYQILLFQPKPPRTTIRPSDGDFVSNFKNWELVFSKLKIDTAGHQFGLGRNSWILVVERGINAQIFGIVVVA